MGVAVLTDVRGYFGGLDATGQNTQCQLEATAADLDATTMGSGGWTALAAGLQGAKLTYSGYAAYGATPGLDQVDDHYWADLIGGTAVPVSLIPTGGAVGQSAYLGQILDTEYKRFDKVGSLDPFEIDGQLSGALAQGFILHPQGTARTTTGTGTGVQFPAVSATQHMYLALHVLSIAGTTPTLTVTVQSATSNAFSSPTTRATWSGWTTQTGGQWSIIPGAVTDTWWRVTWTIGGTTPSYLFAVTAGID